MSEYDAVVYDLDGTLVHLNVDWDQVSRDVRAVYHQAGVEPPADDSWTLLTDAARIGRRDDVESIIADHEREGARTARRLPLAEDLSERSVPVGVCSLNCEAACRIALETHDLLGAVDSITGRDSVASMKPDPEPLLATVDALPGEAADVLFVGDSASDERTAERAGVAFRYVEDLVGLR